MVAAVQARQDIRVATYPTVTGEKIVLRLFGTTEPKSLSELKLEPAVCAELERFLTWSFERWPSGADANALPRSGEDLSRKRGEILAAAQEERFTRKRHDADVPVRADGVNRTNPWSAPCAYSMSTTT